MQLRGEEQDTTHLDDLRQEDGDFPGVEYQFSHCE